MDEKICFVVISNQKYIHVRVSGEKCFIYVQPPFIPARAYNF